MSEVLKDIVPIDSLVVARKVMKGSKSTLEGEVSSVVEQTRLNLLTGVTVREERHIAASLVSQDEYAAKKLGHPRLAIHSVVPLSDEFNAIARRNRDGLTDYVSDVPVGEVQYDKITEGQFVVGFMFSDGFRLRAAQERTQTIDTLLDAAALEQTDPFRQWRNEDDDLFWLPVLKIATADSAAEEILADFCGKLDERTTSLAIDLYDAQARMTIVDMPYHS